MHDALAKYLPDYGKNLAYEQKNFIHKPFFFTIADYRKTSEALESVIALPHKAFIEITPYNKHKKSFEYLLDESPDFALSLSTISCHTSSLAHIFANLLDKRFALNSKKNTEIKICLQEAITNAMLHGNLKMRSDFHTVKGLYAYHEEINKRLILEHYRFSTINIRAWNKKDSIKIAISDDGSGFRIPTYKEDNKSPNGRGLIIIQELSDKAWVEKGSKSLFMDFKKSTGNPPAAYQLVTDISNAGLPW